MYCQGCLSHRVGFMCKCLVKSAVGAQRPAVPFYSHFNKERIRSSIPVRAARSTTLLLSGHSLMPRDFQGLGLSYQPLLYFWGRETWGCGSFSESRAFQKRKWDYSVRLTRFSETLANQVCSGLWLVSSPQPVWIVWLEKTLLLSICNKPIAACVRTAETKTYNTLIYEMDI